MNIQHTWFYPNATMKKYLGKHRKKVVCVKRKYLFSVWFIYTIDVGHATNDDLV